ncbi:MAG: DUF1573 domain-containing protein [Chitinophagaceae bacterium]|nr:DUF1573 domain-containing protein [Chitinophagaceae bacterium]
MKRLFTLLLSACFFAATSAQTAVPASAPVMETLVLKETKYDFGKIQLNRPVTHTFQIINSGKEPLKLDNVQASCGCTTPEWSHEPIQPGATATIKVGYNAANEGPFSKSIAIQYNSTQTATLIISGNVYKGPATSAPVNSSISLLKQTNQ